MYWIHPVWQAAAFCLALYVAYLGWLRFRIVHLGRRGVYPWRRHARLGAVALAALCLGGVIGLAVARAEWGVSFLTGAHAWTGLAIMGLAVTGFVSGRFLDKARKRLFWLPLLHGANNCVLILLTLAQARTGWAFLL